MDEVLYWLSDSPHNSWTMFFEMKEHRMPVDEAIRAYEAIGYKCVEVSVREIEQ